MLAAATCYVDRWDYYWGLLEKGNKYQRLPVGCVKFAVINLSYEKHQRKAMAEINEDRKDLMGMSPARRPQLLY